MPASSTASDALSHTGRREELVTLDDVKTLWCYRARINFGDCDPAGIVFAPRYFEIFARALESFYIRGVDLDHRELISVRRIGLVYANLSCQFFRPLSYGNEIEIFIKMSRVGRSSFATTLHTFHEALEVARGHSINVATSLESFTPVAIPSDIRKALLGYRDG